MPQDELLRTFLPVIDLLESLSIAYYIGGSLAGRPFGIKRAANDIDLVAALTSASMPPLLPKLQTNYYVSEDAIKEALAFKSSFNMISLDTFGKVCMYVLKDTPFEQLCINRALPVTITPNNPRMLYIESPEDLILHKLGWYEQGGGVSDKQWNDIEQVLQHQASKLDQTYLAHWAARLNLTGLLVGALQVAGIQ